MPTFWSEGTKKEWSCTVLCTYRTAFNDWRNMTQIGACIEKLCFNGPEFFRYQKVKPADNDAVTVT
jgi:hypothetical protein